MEKENNLKNNKIKIIEGNFTIKKIKIAIVISRFNNFINKNLLESAIDTLTRIGKIKKKNITVIKIPGAYEIPIIVKIIISKNQYHGIIALGTIIKGETTHFDKLASNTIYQLSNISIKYNTPISLGILMTNTLEQAINRSGAKLGNKGYEAAITILETISVIQMIKKNKNIKNIHINHEL